VNVFKPFLIVLLFIAVPHFFILVVIVITTGNVEYLNIFNVIGLSYFFPDIGKGIISNALSFIISLSIYLFFYFKKFKK